MDKLSIKAAIALLLFSSVITGASFGEKPLVLFDAGHAQKAGNADWVINGGFSDFADVFKGLGCDVREIMKISAEELARASVLVLPEPNSLYTPQEESAIVQFVNDGGSLYAISDHNNSDRNGDGVDSVGVLNRFVPKLGIEFEKRYFSEAPVTGGIQPTSITKDVKAVGTWGGTALKALSSTAQIHIRVSAKNGGQGYLVTSVVGPKGGKVVAMGDSSPYDDGTGDPHDKLHDGFNNPQYSHGALALNSARWLLEKSSQAPAERLSTLLGEIKEGHTALQENPAEGMLLFLENSEASAIRLFDANPELKARFLELSDGSRGLEPLLKDIEVLEAFQKLHPN